MVETSDNKRIKILRIIARLNVGGPAIQALTLTRALNNERFETLLLHGQLGEGEADMTQYRGLDVPQRMLVPELGRELNPIKDIVTLFKLVKIIRRERPDIVHTHTAKAGAAGRAAAAICRVPVIVHTFHGHVFHGYFSKRKTALFIAIEKILARFTTKIVTISQLQKNEISETLRMPESKFTVIPLGFDLEKFVDCKAHGAGQLRAACGIPADAPVVSIVGRITAIKNHSLFLKAARMVADEKPDVRFVVVGDGEDRPACEALVRELKLENNVIFAGWREDVAAVYADTTVTALTSDNEGTPVCLIESLSAGVAVAATDVGGVADVVRHGTDGLLSPPGDADTMAANILELLTNTARARAMGAAGREAMLKRYSRTRMINDIVNL
jgi:glycosyltransferase involved in cell wall biosynthesis